MDDEIKRINIDESHYTEANYPFRIKPYFSTLVSITEILPQGPISGFVFDNTVGNLLGSNETILRQEYNLSPNPVDIPSFDNIFFETDMAQGMIFKGERSGIIHIFTKDVVPGYKYIENFRAGINWFMLEIEEFLSSVNLKLKNKMVN